MRRASGLSYRWLSLAVIIPLLVLALLAWIGSQAQVKAAWASARDEAKVVGALAGEVISTDLLAAVETVPLFPDPPLPGTPSPADAVLDGGDLPALRRLRDDPAAGVSPAGLPRRVLAGFRAFENSGQPADGKVLLGLATGEAPSILTPLALARLGDTGGSQRWTRGDAARTLYRLHPDIGPGGEWLWENDKARWLAADEGKLRFLDSSRITITSKSIPAWADLRISLAGRVIAGSGARAEIMESVPLRFGDGLRLDVLAARPEVFEADSRRQSRWTAGLLFFALALSTGGLALIHRLVERERRLNAMKSDFVASVSHELRAPVASIRLMADALDAEKVAPETVKEFHRLISREGVRLSSLIENVLDFARIEQGRRQWHFESSDLGALLGGTLALMEPLAAEKNITLISTPFPSVEANVDPGAIQQALVNLLDNAIKFSPAGSQVEILLAEHSANWEIQITDQGPGIPLAEHARIFEKFHRLGSELRRETQGTGIGLSLVKAIAEAHGGRVVLASVPGSGSAFTLIGRIGRIGPILQSPTP